MEKHILICMNKYKYVRPFKTKPAHLRNFSFNLTRKKIHLIF